LKEIINCPRCGVKSFYEYEYPLLLPRIVPEEGPHGIKTDVENGIAVRAMVCETCRHIEFKLILGRDDLGI